MCDDLPLTPAKDALLPERPFRRKVFYLPGYDPIHPRRYRELYRKEGAEQARLGGYDLMLRPKAMPGSYGWRVEGRIEGRETRSDFEVLVWSDIVRSSMSNSILATYGQLLRTAWIYIGSGALRDLMRLRKGPMIAALYPVVFLLAQLAFAIGLAWGLGAGGAGGEVQPLAAGPAGRGRGGPAGASRLPGARQQGLRLVPHA